MASWHGMDVKRARHKRFLLSNTVLFEITRLAGAWSLKV